MYYKLRLRGLHIGGSWDLHRMLDFGLDLVVYVLGWWYILCKLTDHRHDAVGHHLSPFCRHRIYVSNSLAMYIICLSMINNHEAIFFSLIAMHHVATRLLVWCYRTKSDDMNHVCHCFCLIPIIAVTKMRH